jgi:arylformamidase
MARIFDISPALKSAIPVWPGDTPFSFASHWALEGDCPVNVGTFTASTHTGAHADAPLHYKNGAKAIDQVDVGRYIGPCVVIDARNSGALIKPEDIEANLPQRVERVLFRTYELAPQDAWDSEFTAIHPDTIALIAARGGILVGIDTPSIDPETSKSLFAHMVVLAHDMSILEGLVLDHIEAGLYELIAPPLKIAGGDASPVRALLREVIE